MSCSEKQISFCDSCKLNPSWCKSSNFYLRGQNMVNINQPSDWSKILRYDLFCCRKCDGQSGPIGTPYSYAIYVTQVYFAFAITSVLGSKWIQLKVLVLTCWAIYRVLLIRKWKCWSKYMYLNAMISFK